MIGIRHGNVMQITGNRAGQTAKAESLLKLLGSQPHQLCGRNQRRKNLPGGQPPSIDGVPFSWRLNNHGDPLGSLICGYNSRDKILSALLQRFTDNKRRGNNACGGMARPRAVLPVQSVAQGSGCKGGGSHADFGTVRPQGCLRFAAADGFTQRHRPLLDGGAFGC